MSIPKAVYSSPAPAFLGIPFLENLSYVNLNLKLIWSNHKINKITPFEGKNVANL